MMGFLDKLKGKSNDDKESNDGHNDHSSTNNKVAPASQFARADKKHSNDKVPAEDGGYLPPLGPPPSYNQSSMKGDTSYGDKDQYQPPPGPPPSHKTPSSNEAEYHAPPGPPPSSEKSGEGNANVNPPPYESWYVVPDNTLLPPPPSIHDDFSPTNNASIDSKDQGFAWCDRFPVYTPSAPNEAVFNAVYREGHIGLSVPREFKGKLSQSRISGRDGKVSKTFQLTTPKSQNDVTLLSNLPLYFAAASNPLHLRGREPVAVSFQIHVIRLASSDSSVVISFSNAPYPSFRLPGWHRGSLAIHSDDGRRYINDSWGGVPFTSPFREGDTIILKASFYPEVSSIQGAHNKHAARVSGLPKCRTRIEMSRWGPGGEESTGWDVHEERDGRMEGVDGLQGEGDLYAAIGICGGVEVEAGFWPQA